MSRYGKNRDAPDGLECYIGINHNDALGKRVSARVRRRGFALGGGKRAGRENEKKKIFFL